MYPRAALKFALLAQLASLASATYSDPKVLDACPGYKAKNVLDLGHKLTADLVLAGVGLDCVLEEGPPGVGARRSQGPAGARDCCRGLQPSGG